MDKTDHENIQDHPAHRAMVEKHRTQEKLRASKADTIVVIQYGNGETVWYSKKDALFAILWDFDLIENIYFATKGDK